MSLEGRKQARRWWWIVLVLLVLLAVVERLALPAWNQSRQPVGKARWIWTPDQTRRDDPVAFFAVRDFELDIDEDLGTGEAILALTGDEEFRVSLNGRLIGAGRFMEGGPLAVYLVGDYLRPGQNRLFVELGSSRGVGGLLVSLKIGGKKPLEIFSDRRWSIVSSYRPGLEEIGSPVDGMAAREWGPPPTGRWGRQRSGPDLPVYDEILLETEPASARRARIGDPAGRWVPLTRKGGRSRPLDRWVTFDFGKIRTGLLEVEFPARDRVEGLVFAGTSVPDPRMDRPHVAMVKADGASSWTAFTPSTFRYVTVVALERVVGARVHLVDAAAAAPLEVERRVTPGVFGLEPPALRPAVEHRFWREFERVTRPGGREDTESTAGL